MKNILLLGATGSIGDSVLNVIKQNNKELCLLGISFNKYVDKAREIFVDHPYLSYEKMHIYLDSQQISSQGQSSS